MYKMNVNEAKEHLSDLINAAIVGEDVFITIGEEYQIKLTSVKKKKRNPKFGSAKGLITMADDFDAPLLDDGCYPLPG